MKHPRLCHPAIFALLLLTAGGPAHPASREEVFDLFSKGKEAFRQANGQVRRNPDRAKDLYRKAALHFERIVLYGRVHNGQLYYNIGNAWFRMGDLGRAILWYRRAGQLTPNDPNLQQNLSYARGRRIDRIEDRERTRVLKTLFFWHYDLSARTRLTLFTIFFGLVWIAAGVQLFVRQRGLRLVAGICALLAAMMFSSLAVEMRQAARPAGVIVAREVIARKGDGQTYQPSFKEPLHAGTEFIVAEVRPTWYHIELADGRRCWIPSQAAELIALSAS